LGEIINQEPESRSQKPGVKIQELEFGDLKSGRWGEAWGGGISRKLSRLRVDVGQAYTGLIYGVSMAYLWL
jgi:hypothetical protein